MAMRRMPRVIPPTWMIWFFLILLGGMYAYELYMRRYVPEFERIEIMRAIVVLAGCVLYAAYRVLAFHPIYRPDYLRWLMTTPWSSRAVLPFGPVRLVGQDAVVLAGLVVAGLGNPYATASHILIAFACTYVLWVSLTLPFSGAAFHAYAIFFLFGLDILCVENGSAALLGISAGLYLVTAHGLRRSLARYPWADSFAIQSMLKANPGSGSRGRSSATGGVALLGWPYAMRDVQRLRQRLPREHGILLSLAGAWFAYVIFALIELSGAVPIDRVLIGVAFGFGPLIRLVVYTGGFGPPFSLWGRIRTLRWIIPRYHVAYVSPLFALVTGPGVYWGLLVAGVPTGVSFALGVLVSLLILCCAGPSLMKWRLTGGHRINETLRLDMIRI